MVRTIGSGALAAQLPPCTRQYSLKKGIMARTKHTPLKEGIVAHTKQTGGEELPPAQQSKRRAAAVVVTPNKRPRADVHGV